MDEKINSEIVDFLLQWEESEELVAFINSGSGGKAISMDNGILAMKDAKVEKVIDEAAEKLNVEIIDFLLQWEDEGEVVPQKRPSQVDQIKKKGSEPVVQNERMNKATIEVISSLTQVDEQLCSVDDWLGEQINRLAEIQSQLSVIETESGQLETSWLNLTHLRDIVTELVDKLSISTSNEDALRKPNVAIEKVLRDAELRDPANALSNLTNALTQLQRGIDFAALSDGSLISKQVSTEVISSTGEKTNSPAISSAEWAEVLNVVTVTSQRNRLLELADAFCDNVLSTLTNLFDNLLKHRYLQDANSDHSVVVRSFNVNPNLLDNSVLCSAVAFSKSISLAEEDLSQAFWIRRHIRKENQLLTAQSAYFTVLDKFQNILFGYSNLNPRQLPSLVSQYASSSNERLYTPLLKALFTSISSECVALSVPFTFSSAKSCNLLENSELSVKFHMSNNRKADSTVPMWIGLEIALQMIAPVINQESENLKRLFHVQSGGESDVSIANTLRLIFDSFERRIIKYCLGVTPTSAGPGTGYTVPAISVTQETDGCEIVAMLVVIEWFCGPEKYFSSSKSTGVSSSGSFDKLLLEYQCPPYMYTILQELKTVLTAKLNSYMLEQINWLHSQKKLYLGSRLFGVLPPFEKFPIFVDQLIEVCGGLPLEPLIEGLEKVCDALLNWLREVGAGNPKYGEVILIHNYEFFHQSMSKRNLSCTSKFVSIAGIKRGEAQVSYVKWMIAYECPSMHELLEKVDNVISRVSTEELTLYVPRKDFISILKELSAKVIESKVIALKQRLDKHFSSNESKQLMLSGSLWSLIKFKFVSMYEHLCSVAQDSYQIKSEVSVAMVGKFFDDVSGKATSN